MNERDFTLLLIIAQWGRGRKRGGGGSEPRRAALARLGKVCGAKLLRLAEQDGERPVWGAVRGRGLRLGLWVAGAA